MHHPFRYSFSVEMGHLFQEVVILHSCGPAIAYGPDTLIVCYRMTLPGGQHIVRVIVPITVGRRSVTIVNRRMLLTHKD